MKKLSVRIITLLLLLVPVLSNAQCSDLFFSEYMEGSSNNKALEIYNPTSTSIDLSDYLVYRNNNGSLTPSATFSPRGILAPDSVYVIVNASSIPSIVSRSDTTYRGYFRYHWCDWI
jgi:predicted extracellular nuclease